MAWHEGISWNMMADISVLMQHREITLSRQVTIFRGRIKMKPKIF